jgi:hypothetical protein
MTPTKLSIERMAGGVDRTFLEYLDRNDASGLGAISGGYFWFRTSNATLLPANLWCRVTPTDPPANEAGTASVFFDSEGHLTKVAIVGPRIVQVSGDLLPLDSAKVDGLFREAGIDRAKCTPTRPRHYPEVYVESLTRLAWTVADEGHGRSIVHVEVGGLNGEPTWFRAFRKWEAEPDQPEVRNPLLPLFQSAVILVILVGGAIVAWHNSRAGRVDRRGAFRIGVTTFAVMFAAIILRISSIGVIDLETSVLARTLMWSLFGAGLSWMLYLAVEPVARRSEPHCLISSTRLIYGSFTDPLVGRDVLWGVFIAIAASSLFRVISVVGTQLDLPIPWYRELVTVNPDANLSLRHALGTVFGASVRALTTGFLVLFLIIGLTGFHRFRVIAYVTVWSILFFTTWAASLHGHPALTAASNMVWAGYVTISVLRFGFLTFVVAYFTNVMIFAFPPSLDAAFWQSGNTSWTAVVLIVALSLFGLLTSTKILALPRRHS